MSVMNLFVKLGPWERHDLKPNTSGDVVTEIHLWYLLSIINLGILKVGTVSHIIVSFP